MANVSPSPEDQDSRADLVIDAVGAAPEAAQLLQATIDGLDLHVALVDHEGEIILTNRAYRAFAERNGGDAGTRAGRGNYLAVCDAAEGEGAEGAQQFAEGLRAVAAGARPSFAVEYPCASVDGPRWFLARVSPVRSAGNGLLVVTHEDITERRRTDEALRQQVRRAEVLRELPALADRYDERTFLQHGMERAEELTGSTISFVHFIQEDGEQIELVAWSRRTLEEYCTAAYDSHYPVSKAGIWADALRVRHPVIFNDYAGYPHKHGLPEGHSPLQRLISVPVVEDGRVVMLAGVGNKVSEYTAFDSETVELIASAMWQIARKARTEQVVHEAAARLDRLTKHVPGALYQFHLRPDGTAVMPYASNGIVDVYGVPPQQLAISADAAFGAMHPEDRDAVQASVAASARDLTLWRNQHRVTLPDGRLKWVEGEATPVAQSDGSILWHGYIRDVTDRVATETRLRTLTRAVEQSDMTIVITDADGSIVYANPHFETSSGYTIAEALGRNPRILQSGQTSIATYQTMWATLLAGREWRGELLNRRKDGTAYWERAVISPVRDARGAIAHFVAVKEDITALKQAEEQRAKLQSQLEHAQKMQSVGRLAGGIAHDFNNLLTVISATVELALASQGPEAPLHEDLTVVQDAARRAMVLTRQLLTFSRQHVVESRDVAVNEVVTRLLVMLDRMVGDDVTIVPDLAVDAGAIRVDVGQLEQVVTNLVLNARDAMPTGGRIAVSTDHLRLATGEQPALPAGDYVRLTVRDTGTGIPADVRERIFDPFFTTKAVGKGTGLGLAIVYAVVVRSGGIVTVDSTVGEGSAFHVFLPRLARVEPARADGQAAEMATGRGVILVVDDEPALGKVAQRMLQRAGFTALLARSGAEALQLVDRTSERIDLLLSDVIMPDMSGPELAAQLRERDPDLRVLFVSGYSGDILTAHGLDAMHYGFLSKPFSLPDLTQKVREVLAE
jgi:two-component system, cell cycle sensor histidine kinase and response regulator CckA